MISPASQQLFDFAAEPMGPERLKHWPPDLSAMDPSWAPVVQMFLSSPKGQALSMRLTQALTEGRTLYPPEPFKMLSLTPLDQVRVVILGQDPYHGHGQAHGLAFSVSAGVPWPPSLRNIFKEIQTSLGLPTPAHGSLVRWAEQGVLLLNTCLTVEASLPASHARWGWEVLTDTLVKLVAQSAKPVVFMLWGAHAQAKKKILDEVPGSSKHLILQSNHPSPLSAMRPPLPFLGCGHFASAQLFALRNGEQAITW